MRCLEPVHVKGQSCEHRARQRRPLRQDAKAIGAREMQHAEYKNEGVQEAARSARSESDKTSEAAFPRENRSAELTST